MGLNSVDPQGLQENPLDVRKCAIHKNSMVEPLLTTLRNKDTIEKNLYNKDKNFGPNSSDIISERGKPLYYSKKWLSPKFPL